jgi:hypothetical protein
VPAVFASLIIIPSEAGAAELDISAPGAVVIGESFTLRVENLSYLLAMG